MDAPLEVLERVETDAVPCQTVRPSGTQCGYDAAHRVQARCTSGGGSVNLFVCRTDLLWLRAGHAGCTGCGGPAEFVQMM